MKQASAFRFPGFRSDYKSLQFPNENFTIYNKYTGIKHKFACFLIKLKQKFPMKLYDSNLKEGHIEKISSCSDENFILSIVPAVKNTNK